MLAAELKKMKKYLLLLIVCLLALVLNLVAQNAVAQNTKQKLTIVSSIAPIHSLLVELTKGAQKPSLLLPPQTMPHGARLTPSQARLLNQAQLLVLVGSNFASFEKNLKQTERRKVVRLTKLQGVKKIHYDKKQQHNEHEEQGEEEQGHEEHEEEEQAHEHSHADGGIDPHLWLDPQNARVIVTHLAEVLGELDQANREIYLKNAKLIDVNLRKLDQEIAKSMRGLTGRFLVLHDATSYFVERYKIKSQENLYGAGHNATRDGMRHSLAVRKKLREGKYRCVFVQTQVPQEVRDRLLASQGQGAKTKIIEINPLSQQLSNQLSKQLNKHMGTTRSKDSPQSADAYADLLRAIAQAFRNCLA